MDQVAALTAYYLKMQKAAANGAKKAAKTAVSSAKSIASSSKKTAYKKTSRTIAAPKQATQTVVMGTLDMKAVRLYDPRCYEYPDGRWSDEYLEFWDDVFYSAMTGGTKTAATGAATGALAGVMGAPFTAGATIPVCAWAGATIDWVGGYIDGLFSEILDNLRN